MTEYIAVPKCPMCDDVMKPDLIEVNHWQCTGCGFTCSKFDLDFVFSDDSD